ncbi:F-box protein At1g67340-like [Hordeum vulgare subsp. vulgare]|uniref:F-box protein At1g67340-like n=1 Tax=Hordeum vulgare subsp. vulgare TaxID=112509 RepID=UPI001D1A3397|nr:F-box protein At1g67340-like [Hordeum vulgare subsp. vulgare]
MAMLHMRAPEAPGRGPDYLDGIPDDLVLSIFSKLAASGTSPSDLLSVYLTCKRLNGLGQQDMVFAKASPASLAAWSEPVQRFLKRCADAGNLEACYILGMIRFYCLGSRSGGPALLAKAAVGGHPAALYSLAVIQFNGSGGAKSDRDLRAGASLWPLASGFGRLEASRPFVVWRGRIDWLMARQRQRQRTPGGWTLKP